MPRSRAIEEEIYTHEYLWRSASMLFEKAEARREASYHILLPCLLMSFMAFEAFINFCGFVLLPELWKEEKKHFKGRGIEGKLEVIVDKAPNFSWRKGEPPYQRIRNLERFRDVVAHGKVLATQYVDEQKEDGSSRVLFSQTCRWLLCSATYRYSLKKGPEFWKLTAKFTGLAPLIAKRHRSAFPLTLSNVETIAKRFSSLRITAASLECHRQATLKRFCRISEP